MVGLGGHEGDNDHLGAIGRPRRRLGVPDCASLPTHLEATKAITERCLVRHPLGIQQALAGGVLEHTYWLPGVENPVECPTRVRVDMLPRLRLLESGDSTLAPRGP